jgi:hypothetical protein
MWNVLFTATRMACESEDGCDVVALGNESRYVEFQRDNGRLSVELGTMEGPLAGEPAEVQSLAVDEEKVELLLSPDSSNRLRTARQVHIPLRLTDEEVEMVRVRLREITCDLIAFSEAVRQ